MVFTHRNILLPLFFLPAALAAQVSEKLSGAVIGTEISYDYSANGPSTSVNTREMAFDGDLSTFFATNAESLGWCGLDLGSRYVITRVGFSPRESDTGPERVVLCVFEGANEEDFSDAVPLYVHDDAETAAGEMTYADVNVSRSFRYVRYVGPDKAHCNVAEVEFYGYEGGGNDSVFYRPSNLPLVSIHVENDAEPLDKVTNLACTVTLIPSDGGDTIKTKTGTVRLRGNASMEFPKKPYRIKFDKKQQVFSSPARAKKWTLINNYGDKTLMRNIVAFEISRRMGMEYTPFCTPVDVMVNGEYKGCYQLCDQVEVGDGRVEVEEMDKFCNSGDILTGGYLVEIDGYASEEASYFYTSRGNPVTIKYPDSDDITPQQYSYISQAFGDMETAVYATSYASGGYRGLLDAETFLKYFLAEELCANSDAFWSTFMYKHQSDDRFYTGPVWDHDLAFDNSVYHPVNDREDWLYTFGSVTGDMRAFVSHIVNDETAANELTAMWNEARFKRNVSSESLLEYIDSTAVLLSASQRLNFIRWPILSTCVHQNWQALGSYKMEVESMKDFLRERIAWIDRKLGYQSTAMERVPVEKGCHSGIVYTLDGRAVGRESGFLPKGVYIKDGKKIVVK